MNSRSAPPSNPPPGPIDLADSEPGQQLPAQTKNHLNALLDLFKNCGTERSDREVALGRAHEEFLRLCKQGELVDPKQFCERYPEFKTSLWGVLEVVRFFPECQQQKDSQKKDADEIPWPEEGQTFRGFVLYRELGRGAFARVFLAREPALGDRAVAVKIARGGSGEAATLGRLHHPNIVHIHSMRQDATTGLTAICMPYLGARTLDHVLGLAFAKSGRFPNRASVILQAAQDPIAVLLSAEMASPAPRVLRHGTYVDGILHLVAQLADALIFIHDKGVYHRDLKPSNILVCPNGTPMLMDFNLAHVGAEAEALLGGTLPYMAPEQLRATSPTGGPDPELLDDRSDLYSLSVILYELLAGVHPFGPIPLMAETETEAFRQLLLERQRHGSMRPLRALNPAVDLPLCQLIERCLAFRQEDRPRCPELAAGLRRGLSPPRRIRRWAARRPLVALGALLLVLTLAVTTVAAGYLFLSTYNERTLAQGRESYRKGNFQEAVDCYSQALQTDPTNAQAWFARGRAYQRLGEQKNRSHFNQALNDFREADRLAASNEAKVCAGYCLNRLGLHQDAKAWYQQAVKNKSFERAEVFNNLGFSFLAGNNLDEARKNLDYALKLNPDLQAAYHNRAWVDYKKAARVLLLGPAARQQLPPKVLQEAKAATARGFADLKTAIRKGPPTAELFMDAARLCALLAPQEEEWRGRGLEHLFRAVVEFGFDPKVLKQELLTKNGSLSPFWETERFKALTERPSPPQPPPPPTRRFLDAVRDDAP